MDQTVATSDDPPVVLGRMPDSFVAAAAGKLRVGKLLRFSIREVSTGLPVALNDTHCDSVMIRCNSGRTMAQY